jgi:hypothetical protein
MAKLLEDFSSSKHCQCGIFFLHHVPNAAKLMHDAYTLVRPSNPFGEPASMVCRMLK